MAKQEPDDTCLENVVVDADRSNAAEVSSRDAADATGGSRNGGVKQPKPDLAEESAFFKHASQVKDDVTSTELGAFLRTLTTHASEYDPRFSQPLQFGVEWRDLNYTIQQRERKLGGSSMATRTILSGLSGSVLPGQFLAVMGPTASGKTTLLNALADRLPIGSGGTLTGEVLVNGKQRTRKYKAVVGYVLQDDVLFSNLSVQETFQVAADLRLPRRMPRAVKQQVISTIISELNLTKAVDTHIGNSSVRGVSGGERRRVSIGLVLLTNPSIIFLDEATTGLDAFQAQMVMESVGTLASHGRTCVVTIHQPRSSIYALFEQLLLISGGRAVYFGPAQKAVEYFAAAGMPCPALHNPAEFFLDMMSLDCRTESKKRHSHQRIEALAAAFKEQQSRIPTNAGHLPNRLSMVEAEHTFANGCGWQFLVLLRRGHLQFLRDYRAPVTGLILTAIVAVIIGIAFLDLGMDQQAIEDRLGVLFFTVVFLTYSSMQPVLDVFPVEQHIINRERASKSYQILPYFASKLVNEMPALVVSSALYSVIVYFMAGLTRSAGRFFIFWSASLLLTVTGQSWGMAISAAVPHQQMAAVLSTTFMTVQMLSGGFYVNGANVVVWIRWVRYLCFMYWAYMAYVTNEFKGRCCWTCCAEYNHRGECVAEVSDAVAARGRSGCLTTGDQILDQDGFGGWPVWAGFLGMAGCMVVQLLVGYFMLAHIKRPRWTPLQPPPMTLAGGSAEEQVAAVAEDKVAVAADHEADKAAAADAVRSLGRSASSGSFSRRFAPWGKQ